MTQIEHPTLGRIEFPDGMTDADITSAIKRMEVSPSGRASAEDAAKNAAAWETGDAADRAKLLIGNFLPYAKPELATATRLAPMAAAAAFPPTSPLGLAAVAVLGAGSEAAARAIEGKDVTSSEGFGAMARSGIINGAPLPKFVGGGLKEAFIQGTKGASAAMATGAAADIAGSSLENERLPGFGSAWEALKNQKAVGALGFVIGGTASRLQGIADKVAENEARRSLLAEVGVTNPTLGMLDPDKATWEMQLAARNPELAQRIQGANSAITREFFSQVGDAPANSAVAARMQALIPVADRAESALKIAQETRAKAEQKLSAALADTTLPPADRSKIAAEAASEILSAVSAQAGVSYAASAALGPMVTNTVKAQELQGAVKSLFKARSDAASAMYAATGIDAAQPIFDKGELVTSVKAALGDHANTNAGKSILGAITDAAGESQSLSLNQLRELRGRMSDAFAGIPEGSLDSAERLATLAYGAAGQTGRKTIANTFGQTAADAYDAAQAFWRQTSQIRDSKFGRALLKGEVSDTTLTAMAGGLATGNVDELANFQKFIGQIEAQNPEVAKFAMQTMSGAIKNAFVTKHTVGGVLRFDRLLDDLANASKFEKLPVPIESFGFGSRDTIMEWKSVLRDFKPSQLTPGVIDEVLANPRVQQVLKNGGVDSKSILAQTTAREIFNAKVQQQVALAESGALAGAKAAAEEARVLADKARLTEGEAAAQFAKTMDDPILGAFRGSGNYKLTNEAARTGPGTVTHLISNMPPDSAGRLMKALRTNNSALADMVERRIVADEFINFIAPEKRVAGETNRFDLARVRQYFNPIDRANSRVEFLRNTIGEDKTKRLERFVTSMASLEDEMRLGRMPSQAALENVITGLGVSGAVGMGKPTYTNTLIIMGRRIRDAVGGKYYNLLANAVLDPESAGKLMARTGAASDALVRLPPQKAYLLLADPKFTAELGLEDNGRRSLQPR